MAETEVKGKDDNIMAAIAHASIIIPFGIILAAGIWLTQKEKSKYVAFQALQATAYQLALMVAGVILGILAFVFTLIISILTFGLGGFLMLPIMLVFLLIAVVAVVYALYGAYLCYEGKDFKYAVIGDLVAKRT